MKGILYGIGYLGYLGIGIIQLIAIYCFFYDYWDWWAIFAGLVAVALAYIPKCVGYSISYAKQKITCQ